MKKFFIVIVCLVVLATCVTVYIAKKTSNANKPTTTEALNTNSVIPTEIEDQNILVDEEDDGSYTFHLPITITKPETGESITRITTINSKEMPAKVLVDVDGDKFELHISLENNTINVEVASYAAELPVLQTETM